MCARAILECLQPPNLMLLVQNIEIGGRDLKTPAPTDTVYQRVSACI